MRLALVKTDKRRDVVRKTPERVARPVLNHAVHRPWFFVAMEHQWLESHGETALRQHLRNLDTRYDLTPFEYRALLLGVHYRNTKTRLFRPLTRQALRDALAEGTPGWDRFGTDEAGRRVLWQLEADICQLLRYSPDHRHERYISDRARLIMGLIGTILFADQLNHALS